MRCGALASLSLFGALHSQGRVLRWNGGAGAVWDRTSLSWQAVGGESCAWEDGACAEIPASTLLSLSDTVKVSGLVLGDGAVVGGRGMILATGEIEVASEDLASLAVPVWSEGGLSKTGTGVLVANMLYGPITVSAGELKAGGRDSERLSAQAFGGTFSWVAGDTTADNLVSNGSFEDGTRSFSSYYNFQFVSGDDMPTGWTSDSSFFVWMLQGGSSYLGNNGTGVQNAIPDGSLMAGIRHSGEFSQTVTIAEAGLYDLSFVCFKRKRTDPFNESPLLEVSIDGQRRYRQHVFWRTGSPIQWQRVSTGPVYLTAGSRTITFSVDGSYGDRMAQIDDVKLLPCIASAAPVKSPVAEVSVADGQSAAARPTLSDNMFSYLFLTKTGPGKTTIPQGLSVPRSYYLGDVADLPANLTVSVSGELELTGELKSSKKVSGTLVNKLGPGAFSVRGGTSGVRGFDVYEGRLNLACTGDQEAGFELEPDAGITASVALELAADATVPFARAMGPGRAVVATSGSGHRLSVTNAFATAVPTLTFDVGAEDVVSVTSFVQTVVKFTNEDNGYKTYTFNSSTALVKCGPGTLLVEAAPPADSAGLAGTLEVRDGTLRLNADDTSASPLLGSIGRPISLAPAGTAATAAPCLCLGSGGITNARPIVVGADGVRAKLKCAEGGSAFTGTLTLGRAETVVEGPEEGVLALGSVVRASGVSETVYLRYTGNVTVGSLGEGVVFRRLRPAGMCVFFR